MAILRTIKMAGFLSPSIMRYTIALIIVSPQYFLFIKNDVQCLVRYNDFRPAHLGRLADWLS